MYDVLKSKRFVSAVIGVIVILLTAWRPEFANVNQDVIAAVVLALIAGYSIEDVVSAWLLGRPIPGSDDAKNQ